MFESLINLFRSDEDKRQELINAYLDGALSPRDKARFEDRLADDRVLKSEVEQYRWLQQSIMHLPRSKAPRNFTLDPAVYAQPASRFPLQIYTALRAVTAMVAIIFFFLVGIDLISTRQGSSSIESSIAQDVAAPEMVAPELGQIAALDLADGAAAEQEGLQFAPEVAEAEPLPVEGAVEEETVVLEEEAGVEKEAAQETSAFRLEQENDDLEMPAEEIGEDAAPGAAAPDAAAPDETVFGPAAAEESLEGTASDVQSESVRPSPSEPLIDAVDGAAIITPTITFNAVSEDSASYPGDPSLDLDTQLAQTTSVPAGDDATVPGGYSSTAASPEPIIEEQAAIADPTIEPQTGDQSAAVTQAGDSTLTFLQIILGASLILLIIITLLVRSRAKFH